MIAMMLSFRQRGGRELELIGAKPVRILSGTGTCSAASRRSPQVRTAFLIRNLPPAPLEPRPRQYRERTCFATSCRRRAKPERNTHVEAG